MQRLVIMVLEGNRSCKFLIAQLAHSQSLCCDPLPFADIFKTEHIVADFGSALRQNAVMHRFIYHGSGRLHSHRPGTRAGGDADQGGHEDVR